MQAISLNTATSLTAVVSDDPNNAGVDWSLLCQSNSNCGTLLPLHTASGAPASYTHEDFAAFTQDRLMAQMAGVVTGKMKSAPGA